MKRAARLFIIGVLALASSLVPTMADQVDHATRQTLCPVMEGNPIKESIYVDYQGERVYFCCEFCKAAFTKEPGKYLEKLPQFEEADTDITGEAHEHGHASSEAGKGWRLYRFTGPLGIATYSLLVLTLCTGLLRRKLKRRFLKIHTPLAFTALAVATLHALTVLLGH
jgi:YHS domain-containing protein